MNKGIREYKPKEEIAERGWGEGRGERKSGEEERGEGEMEDTKLAGRERKI